MTTEIAPSILSADFAALGLEAERMKRAGARMLHFDVMDGHFVPNLTFGLPVLESLRRVTDLHLDVHLMISNPDEMAERYVDAGADSVAVHIETVRHLDRLLKSIRTKGAQPGAAINPHTPLNALDEVLPLCDFVLVMSVNPGYPGQPFLPYCLEKVSRLRRQARERGLRLDVEIDGGIGLGNVGAVAQAGANWIVSGSAIFGSEDPEYTFKEMRRAALQGSSMSAPAPEQVRSV